MVTPSLMASQNGHIYQFDYIVGSLASGSCVAGNDIVHLVQTAHLAGKVRDGTPDQARYEL